jgi:hypothetical protein
MTVDPSFDRGTFAARHPVGEEEILKLRRTVWADGNVSPDEASRLFALNDEAEPSRDWVDFFVEAMCDYLISRGQPRGWVSEADAQWLMGHVDSNGRIASAAELELVVKLLERAEYVPDSLKTFALREIEQTVLTGSGPTRSGETAEASRIDDTEAAILRRLIFAPAGDGPAKVSRAEAEMLFRLKDATLNADNAADWKRLFVQGVANHLMAHQAYAPPSPEVEARLESPYKADPWGHVLSRLGHESPDFKDAFAGDGEASRIAAQERAVKSDAEVTSEELEWLKRLFEGDGARDPLEQALLDFLAEDGVRPF